MSTSSNQSVFNQIRSLVCLIPAGKVATYGLIAKALGYRNSRIIGYAIRGNKDPTIPCHRVVFKDGSLATNYSFGGKLAQRQRLESEDVVFNINNQVELTRHLFSFSPGNS